MPTRSYVNYVSLDPDRPLTVSAQLCMPDEISGKVPAVVIAHGSAGIGSRGLFYAAEINKAGIATLEIDMWAARGWFGGVSGRPLGVPETLPDAYGALKFLSLQPHIDTQSIGILGFSWGGIVALLCATQPYTQLFTQGELNFAAHVANYPVCWLYNQVPGYEFSSFTGAPVLIQAGELDAYDNPDTCTNLVESLAAAERSFISLKLYKGATHAWDRLESAITITDQYSHLGRGGEVPFVPNPAAAYESRSAAVMFFERAFGLAAAVRDRNKEEK
jgi:dienelactone hydrolase